MLLPASEQANSHMCCSVMLFIDCTHYSTQPQIWSMWAFYSVSNSFYSVDWNGDTIALLLWPPSEVVQGIILQSIFKVTLHLCFQMYCPFKTYCGALYLQCTPDSATVTVCTVCGLITDGSCVRVWSMAAISEARCRVIDSQGISKEYCPWAGRDLFPPVIIHWKKGSSCTVGKISGKEDRKEATWSSWDTYFGNSLLLVEQIMMKYLFH